MEKLHELQDAMSVLIRQEEELREACEENGGEETPETIDLEAAKEATKELIQTDGIDMLGRRLVYLEDKLKMWKAEKAAASSVAEETTTLRSRRRARTRLRMPRRKSMLSERSWASSMMIVS